VNEGATGDMKAGGDRKVKERDFIARPQFQKGELRLVL